MASTKDIDAVKHGASESPVTSARRSIGILGFGALGQYIYDAITSDEKFSRDFEVCFVWNRTSEALQGRVPDKFILEDIDQCMHQGADAIIEVCHPSISKSYGSISWKTEQILSWARQRPWRILSSKRPCGMSLKKQNIRELCIFLLVHCGSK